MEGLKDSCPSSDPDKLVYPGTTAHFCHKQHPRPAEITHTGASPLGLEDGIIRLHFGVWKQRHQKR
jgi:hypothetical protein